MAVTEKLKEAMKKVEPWQWAAGLVVAGFGLYKFFSSGGRASAAQTTTEVTPTQAAQNLGGVTDAVTNSQMQNFTDQVNAQLDEVYKNIAAGDTATNNQLTEVSGKLVTMQTGYTDALNKTNDAIAKVASDSAKQTADTATALSKTLDNISNAFTGYKNNTDATLNTLMLHAYSTPAATPSYSTPSVQTQQAAVNAKQAAIDQIAALKNQWVQANNTFSKDGVISESEAASLEKIHQQAESIGIAAGFGAGGEDGSNRKYTN